MARKAGVITINLNAGTAQFFADMDRANAKIREFGTGHVTEARATAAAMKTLEGNLLSNTRAADKFLESVLGMGPVMQAAFPIIGGIAFGGMLVDIGKKAYEFWKGMQEGPKKIAIAFRELNAPLRLTNDELALSNARLANDIAQLEGKRQNNLAVALAEAVVQADKLADSLDKDLSGLDKLLEQQKVGFWEQLFGKAGTSDLKEEIGDFRERIADITAEGNEKIRRATDLKAKDAAQLELNTKLQKAYGDELAKVNQHIKEAQDLAKPRTVETYGYAQGPVMRTTVGADESARLKMLESMRIRLQYESAGIDLSATQGNLAARKTALQESAAAAVERPFEDRMNAIRAQIDAVNEKMKAIGQPEAAQIMAKAFGDAEKAITEVNKTLEHHQTQLTGAQKAQITAAEQTLATAEAEAQWRTRLAASTTAINDRIASTNLLTAAIGKGYEAVRAANVESRLMEFTAQYGADWARTPEHNAEIAQLRSRYQAEFDAKHGEQQAQAIAHLHEQIDLEHALAAAQAQGAEAVRQAALAERLRQLGIAGASREQLAVEKELAEAQRENAVAAGIAKIDERIEATERLTAATLKSAAAVREATLANRLAAIAREGDVGGQRAAAATREASADRGLELARVVARTDRVRAIDDEIATLEEARATLGDTAGIETRLLELEQQRLKAAIDETLALGRARDGVKAFFEEMQMQAKTSASIIYDALNEALDRTSANLAKLITGQGKKGDWGAEFKEIGTQMTESTIKSVMQKGLGAFGGVFGIGGKADGSSAASALWVRIAGGGGAPSLPLPGAGGGGGEGGGGTPWFASLFSGWMAGGGDVLPGNIYGVGESGPEFFIPSSSGQIVPRAAVSGTSVLYHIDARGADLGASNRIRQAIEMSHRVAVATAVQASHERARRVPSK